MVGDVKQKFQGAGICKRHENRGNVGQYQCLFLGRKEFIYSQVFKINANSVIHFEILFNTVVCGRYPSQSYPKKYKIQKSGS